MTDTPPPAPLRAALPMPTFTEVQLDFARRCESHLKLRAHHNLPVPDEVVVTSMQAAINAVSEYAAKFGVKLPRWHEIGMRRYEETIHLVEDLFALECDLPQDDPLSVVFRTTLFFTATPLFREANKRRRSDERRVHRKQDARREATVNVRAYKILQYYHADGIRIGELARQLYDLAAPAPPRSKFYARTQGILQYLAGLGRAQTMGRGLWTWKRTPEEEAEIEKLRAEVLDDAPFVVGPPVVVTIEGPEEIPEEDDS